MLERGSDVRSVRGGRERLERERGGGGEGTGNPVNQYELITVHSYMLGMNSFNVCRVCLIKLVTFPF